MTTMKIGGKTWDIDYGTGHPRTALTGRNVENSYQVAGEVSKSWEKGARMRR